MDGCWFPLETPDDFAVNKLFGLSYGMHHNNSIRVGWTPANEPGHIDLFFYFYINGMLFEKPFCVVEIGKKYTIEIDISNNQASFTIAGRNFSTTIDSYYFPLPKFQGGYTLFPHVGGGLPARVDTKIYIDFLN